MDILALNSNVFHVMDNFSKYDLIKEAMADLLDGTKNWKEIQAQTGLSAERSLEIYHLFTLIQVRGKHKSDIRPCLTPGCDNAANIRGTQFCEAHKK